MSRSSMIDHDMAETAAPPASGLRNLLMRAWRRFEQHLSYRRSLRALAELDDRLLEDVGFRRADVCRDRAGEGVLECKHWRWAAN
jgi:uncharacterized protein YjiS (DUF1127 family)